MQVVNNKQSVIAFLRGPDVRTVARPALASAMRTDGEQSDANARFELKCSAYQLKGATLGFGAAGTVYKLSCRFVTVSDLKSLQEAAESRAPLRLVFPDGSIVLSHLKLQHLTDGWTGIEGGLVAAQSTRNG
jgi:hypothetical protein